MGNRSLILGVIGLALLTMAVLLVSASRHEPHLPETHPTT